MFIGLDQVESKGLKKCALNCTLTPRYLFAVTGCLQVGRVRVSAIVSPYDITRHDRHKNLIGNVSSRHVCDNGAKSCCFAAKADYSVTLIRSERHIVGKLIH